MMCQHCEARVRSALEELPFVESAAPDHENGTVVLAVSAPSDEKQLKKAVSDAGYKYKGIAK